MFLTESVLNTFECHHRIYCN